MPVSPLTMGLHGLASCLGLQITVVQLFGWHGVKTYALGSSRGTWSCREHLEGLPVIDFSFVSISITSVLYQES